MPRILLIILTLSMTNADQFVPSSYLNINDLIKFGHDIIGNVNQKFNLEQLRHEILNISIIENKISDHFKSKMGESMIAFIKSTTVILKSGHTSNDSQSSRTTLFKYINTIDRRFNEYIDVMMKMDNIVNLCTLDIIKLPLNSNIQHLSIDSHLTFAFEEVLHEMRNYKSLLHRCDINVTIPDQIVALYNVMAAVERKKLAMEAFIYKAKSKCSGLNNTDKLMTIQSEMTRRISEYLHAVKILVAYVPRDLYYCDTSKFRQGRSSITDDLYQSDQPYIELKGYQRSVIINERDQLAADTCSSTCEDFIDGRYVHIDDISRRSEYCLGKLTSCKSAGNVEFCEMKKDKSSSRPYQWIKDGAGTVYGKMGHCKGHVMRNDTWYRWAVKCDNCICTCIDDVESSPSRYGISLKEESADMDNNEVVTGIRFTLQDRLIYPQIQTGKLLPEGNIEASTITWKPVNPLEDILHNTVGRFPGTDFVQFGTDFENVRSINLEDVYAENGYVVTGIRFVTLHDIWPKNNGVTVGFNILTTKYDYTTGRLLSHTNEWMNSVSSIHLSDSEFAGYDENFKKTELILDHPDNPLNYPINFPDSKHGQYIQFRASDLKKDAGQSTVPFFDSTPVVGAPSIPLGGIGLFHKSVHGSGGFLAFKIMSLDLSKDINTVNVKQQKNAGVHIMLNINNNTHNIAFNPRNFYST